MPLRTRLLVYGYPALELLTAWIVASYIGWWNVLGLFLIGAVVGIIIMGSAGRAAFATMQQAARSGALPDGSTGGHGLTFLGGALVAIPGFWTDLVGLALCLPPVQRLLRPRFARWFGVTRLRGGADVIQGTVIYDAGNDEAAGPKGPAALDN